MAEQCTKRRTCIYFQFEPSWWRQFNSYNKTLCRVYRWRSQSLGVMKITDVNLTGRLIILNPDRILNVLVLRIWVYMAQSNFPIWTKCYCIYVLTWFRLLMSNCLPNEELKHDVLDERIPQTTRLSERLLTYILTTSSIILHSLTIKAFMLKPENPTSTPKPNLNIQAWPAPILRSNTSSSPGSYMYIVAATGKCSR